MKICLVGNAPLKADQSAIVDRNDMVVRFNRPRTLGGKSGEKFNIWVIANLHGGRKFYLKQRFLRAPYKNTPKQIWFPRDGSVHDELNNGIHAPYEDLSTIDCGDRIKGFNALRQPTLRFDRDFYWRCLQNLGYSPSSAKIKIPSAGFMALCFVQERYPDAEISMVGFGFKGWHGHPWKREKRYTLSLHGKGKLHYTSPSDIPAEHASSQG